MQDLFLPNLFRMRHIQRWSLMHNMRKENLSEHSFECALLVHHLALIGNTYFAKSYAPEKLACFALYHDAAEILTGDLPTPIKKFDQEISSSYRKIETKAAQKIVEYLPPEMQAAYNQYFDKAALSEDETNLLAAADKLCAFIKCITEINAGNREFTAAYNTNKKQIEALELPEVRHFLEHNIPAFSYSLDELQGFL